MEKDKELITQECVVTDTEELLQIIESLEDIGNIRGEQ